MLNIVIPKATQNIEHNILMVRENFGKGIRKGANNAGRSVQKRVANLLTTGSRTGRKYKGMPHTSSAPGENPRSQSGRLLNSVYYHANSTTDFRLGATEKHAIYLTEGTRFMMARPHRDLPFMELAIELEERNTENYLQDGPYQEIKC